MADDEGTAFLRNPMSEGQTDSPEGRGVSGRGSRGDAPKGSKSASSMTGGENGPYQDEWDKPNFNAGGSKRVNRKDKGDRGSGVIGSDEWNQNKYGGNGY